MNAAPTLAAAAEVLRLQRSIGNQAVGRLLGGRIQRQPDFHLNKDTGRSFRLTFSGEQIDADETEASAMQSEPPLHSGYLIYRVYPEKKVLALKTVISDPEEGTGLGVLLMWAMAKRAVQLGMKQVEVLSPAKDKLGYYARFGFDIAERQEEVRKQYLHQGVKEEEMPDPIPVGSAFTTPQVLLANTSASLNKRWKPVTLPPPGSSTEMKEM